MRARQGLLSSNTGRSTNPPHPCSLGPSSLRGPFVSGAASGAATREHWRAHRSAGSQAASQRRGLLPTRAIGPNRDHRCISPTKIRSSLNELDRANTEFDVGYGCGTAHCGMVCIGQFDLHSAGRAEDVRNDLPRNVLIVSMIRRAHLGPPGTKGAWS
jgi:hypothetical protein